MRELRGRGHRSPFPAAGAVTLAAEQDRDTNGTGFRLVHDDSGQVRRGGGWIYDPQNARGALRSGVDPASRFDSIGLRLVADWRKG